MELNESAAEGAARETLEEAQAQVHNLRLFSWMDIPVIGQAVPRPDSLLLVSDAGGVVEGWPFMSSLLMMVLLVC